MKVTLVTCYFAPEITPVTHLYGDLAADLTALGDEVTVVTNMPNRGLTEAARQSYLSRTDERAAAGYRILRTGPVQTEGTGLVRRGLHLLRCTVSLFRAAKRVETDAYLLGSMPPFLGLVGAALAKKARTVYIVQDIFPDSLFLMGRFTHNPIVGRLCRWMERRTYRGNTRFVTISTDMQRTLVARGVARERIDVIPNWADAEAIRPIVRAKNSLFDELGIARGGFTAIYAGTLGVLQNPDLLLDAAKHLLPLCEATILILGGGALYTHVAERIEREGLTNVRLFPLMDASRGSEVYSLGDIALIPLKRGVADIAMPSKTWTAMAAARPVVITAEERCAWAKVVREADCGSICPPDDAKALADEILRLSRNRGALPAMGLRAREYVQTHLVRMDAAKAYHRALTKE